MKIKLKEPESPYHCVIDTDVMEVELKEVFLGVTLVTESGEKLSICMRDNGFELRYYADFGEQGFDIGGLEFKDGRVRTTSD